MYKIRDESSVKKEPEVVVFHNRRKVPQSKQHVKETPKDKKQTVKRVSKK